MLVLLADDLKPVHSYIENCLDWGSLGVSRILHAYNGQECIDIVNSQKPDILLLDIKMPIMDGIEALRRLSEGGLMPKTVIVSAYDEFQFARKAMIYGAIDYILKPIDIESLIDQMRNIIIKLQAYYLSEIKNALLDVSFEEQMVDSRLILEKLRVSTYFCILVRFEGNAERILKAAAGVEKRYPLTVRLSQSELFVIVSKSREGYEDEVKQVVEFYRNSQYDEGFRVSIGISSMANADENDLREVYGQCIDALNARFYLDDGVYIYHQPDSNRDIGAAKITQYKERIVKSILDNTHTSGLQAVIKELFSDLSACMTERTKAIDICYNILVYVVNYLFIVNNSTETENLGRTLFYGLEKCSGINDLKRKFTSVIFDSIPKLESESPVKTDRTIDEVKHYLETNYHLTLTLESISREFYISKYEVCRRFKVIIGENIWDYIKKLRMENARYMLVNTDMKIYEISKKVGYNDPTYFSNLFKKYFGQSPLQFRNK